MSASDCNCKSTPPRPKPARSETQVARTKGLVTSILRKRIVELRLEGHSVDQIATKVRRSPAVVDQVLIDELNIGRRVASRFLLMVGQTVASLATDILTTTRRECIEEREVA